MQLKLAIISIYNSERKIYFLHGVLYPYFNYEGETFFLDKLINIFKEYTHIFLLMLVIQYTFKSILCIRESIIHRIINKKIILYIVIAAGILIMTQYEISISDKIQLSKHTYAHDSTEQYDDIVTKYMKDNKLPGIAVGIVDTNGSHIITHGMASKENEVTQDTLFEIGSISKAYTGIILADFIERGEVQLSDNVKLHGKQIEGVTLESLITHTSGLPSIPTNIGFKINTIITSLTGGNPYSNMNDLTLINFLETYKVYPEKEWNYSNIGVGLLGVYLEQESNSTYDEILGNVITDPLNMANTTIESVEGLATGYRKYIRLNKMSIASKAKPWDTNGGIAAMGGIRSSVKDMVRFLDASILDETPSIQLSKKELYEIDEHTSMAMGWIISKKRIEDNDIIWHNGGTGGFSSYLAIVEGLPVGVVILTNKADVDLGQLADKIMEISILKTE